MKLPTLGVLHFLNGVRTLGFLQFAGQAWRTHAPQWEMQGTLHLGNGLPMTITPR